MSCFSLPCFLLVSAAIIFSSCSSVNAHSRSHAHDKHNNHKNSNNKNHGNVTPRPIIGVMTQPTNQGIFNKLGTSFVNADYVKFIELAGGRVVPVHYEDDKEQLKNTFNSINGILYPGGDDILNGTKYYESAAYIMDLALAANDAGDFFPVWGTCLGFQFLNVYRNNGDVSILTHFDSENISLPVTFTPAASSSLLFSRLSSSASPPYYPLSDFDYLSSSPVTSNYHHYGVSPDTFDAKTSLNNFYNVLATSQDREGAGFITAIEAKKYPVFGVQFHPERSLFEFDPNENLDHSEQTLKIMQSFSNLFVSLSRRSAHSFASVDDEFGSLIWNTPVVPTFETLRDDMQIYAFNYTATSRHQKHQHKQHHQTSATTPRRHK